MDISDTVADSNCMASHFFNSLQYWYHLGLNFIIKFSDGFKNFFLLKLLLFCEFLVLELSHKLSVLCLLFHFLKTCELIFYDIFSYTRNFFSLSLDQLVEDFLEVVQDEGFILELLFLRRFLFSNFFLRWLYLILDQFIFDLPSIFFLLWGFEFGFVSSGDFFFQFDGYCCHLFEGVFHCPFAFEDTEHELSPHDSV